MEAGVAGNTMSALERSAGQAQARFEKMGMAIETLDENGNLPDLLADMQQEFGDKYTTETGTQIQQAFGSEEAVKFFKALWGQQDTFRANAKALEQTQRQGDAFTRTMAKNMDNHMDVRLQVLQQRWNVIKEKIGNALIPVLEKLMSYLEKAADWTTPREDAPARAAFNNIFTNRGLEPPHHVIECSSLMATRALLMESDRAALLSKKQVAIDVAQGLLAISSKKLPDTGREIGITTRIDWKPTRLQARFMEILSEQCQADSP